MGDGCYYISSSKIFHHPVKSYQPSLLLFAERLNAAKFSWKFTKLGIRIWCVVSHHSIRSLFHDHFFPISLDFKFTHPKLLYFFPTFNNTVSDHWIIILRDSKPVIFSFLRKQYVKFKQYIKLKFPMEIFARNS